MFQCFHARDFSIQTRLNYNYIVCLLNQKLPIVQGLSLDRLWNLGSWDGNLHIDSDSRHWLNSCYKIFETFHNIFRMKLKSNYVKQFNHTSMMLFNNGSGQCGDERKNRSTTIYFFCGSSNYIIQVEEPEECVYNITFSVNCV